VCPFTTDRVADLLDVRIFEAEPDLVLCVEIAGPDNPYAIGSPPFVSEDVRGFVFDMLRDGESGFLAPEQQRALCERYTLPTPRQYGRFHAGQWREIRDIAKGLDAEGREGVVLKAEQPRQHRTKYVTLSSGIYDIKVRAADMAELPGEYFTGRILRMALFMDETGLVANDRICRDLGRALLDGLFESLADFKRQRRVFHPFRCRFRQRPNAEDFVDHLRRTLGHAHLRVERLERAGDYWLLEFVKEVPKLSGLFEQLFRGEAIVD
jgi:putative ATP-dependent DNA ligase